MDGALSSDPSIPHPVETIDDASQKKQSLGWSGLRKHTVTPFVLPSTSYVAKGKKHGMLGRSPCVQVMSCYRCR